MSDIELKPCPSCNGQAEMGYESACYYVYCTHCNTCGATEMDIPPDAEEQAAAAWNALPRHLHWTRETPTEPGWYWCRSNVQPKDAAIVFVRDGAFELDEELIEAASLRFQWAGPIPEPQEQP